MAFTDRLHNRGSISTGYDIDNSLKFEIDNSESIVTTNQAAGNQKTWTWSGWLKRTELDGTQAFFGAGGTYIRFVSGDTLNVQQSGTSLTTNQVFRDTSAWYHVVWILDTTQSTEADRSRIYINGSQITSFSSATYPSQNADLDVGGLGSSSNWLQLGRWYAGGRRYSGYIAEVHYLNGTVAAPTEFGEYDEDSGIWIPKEYTGGGYGTQGYYYKFDNASNLGEDSSGEGHDASSLINITSADQATDTPTNNFCILNGLTQSWDPATSAYTTEGGTTYNGSYSNPEYALMASTFGVSRGKWYWEVKNSGTNGSFTGTGAMRYENPNYDTFISGTDGGIATYYTYGTAANKIYYFNGSAQTTVAYSSFPNAGTGEIISIALDMDNGKIYFAINNTWGNSGNPATGTNPVGLPSGFITDTYTPAASVGSSGTSTAYYNFGGYTEGTISSPASDENGYGNFEYAPPSGYYALCTKNLAEYG